MEELGRKMLASRLWGVLINVNVVVYGLLRGLSDKVIRKTES